MSDDHSRLLLELLAEYLEHYGPHGSEVAGGEPPSNLLVSELAGDLRESLPERHSPLFDRCDAVALV